MGEANARRARFFAEHPKCCFCGGIADAVEEDHQPPRSMFDGRRWPEGYAFPACAACNRASARAEHVLSVVTRMGLDLTNNQKHAREWRNLCRAMKNNFPELARLMTPNEKRSFFRSEGLDKPQNSTWYDLPSVALDAGILEPSMRLVLTKLFCALHYKHAETIVPRGGKIFHRWITNAYAHRTEHLADFVQLLDRREHLQRGSKNLSDQFDYVYQVSPDRDASALFCTFRKSLVGYGLVFCDPRASEGCEEEDLASPFDWPGG